MTYLTEEDLIGPVEEAAELQSMLGVDVTRGEFKAAAPPRQPPLAYGTVGTSQQRTDGATSTTPATTDTKQALEQQTSSDTATPADSNTSSLQEQAAVSNHSSSDHSSINISPQSPPPDSIPSTPQEQEQEELTTTDSSTNPRVSATSPPSIPKKSKSKSKPNTTNREPTKRTTSSPNPGSTTKRKYRTFDNDADDEYRAPFTPRSKPKARRSKGVANADSSDEEYSGAPRLPTRTMTRPTRRVARYSSNPNPDPYAEQEDQSDSDILCLATCSRAEDDSMLDCSGSCEGKFHAACVGFRALLPGGRRWLCFGCRKERGLGMRTNGVVGEEDGELAEVESGGRGEDDWRRDGWMV